YAPRYIFYIHVAPPAFTVSLFHRYRAHRALHSFPTRRSSDLRLGHTGRGDRGIDPAGHGGQYTQSHSAFSVCASPGSKPRPGHTRPVGECGRRFCENCSMALFRRRRPTDSTSATTEFWDYWPKVRQTLSEAVELGRPAPSEAAEKVSAL